MLIGELKKLLDEYPDDAEVRIAHQPQWPFEYEVKGLIATSELGQPQRDAAYNRVWIVEGPLIGPTNKHIWRDEFRKRVC